MRRIGSVFWPAWGLGASLAALAGVASAQDTAEPLTLPTVRVHGATPGSARPEAPSGVSAEATPSPDTVRRPTPRNTVTLHPIEFVWASWQIEYERALTDWFSLYVTPGFVPITDSPGGGIGLFGGSLDLGARWFPFGRAPDGFFLAAIVGLTTTNLRFTTSERGIGVRAGGMLGYTFVIERVLVASLGVGGHAVHFAASGAPGTDDHGDLIVRLALGVAF